MLLTVYQKQLITDIIHTCQWNTTTTNNNNIVIYTSKWQNFPYRGR